MIIEGIKLLILGMGVVFSFLLLLYAAISYSSVVLSSFTENEIQVLEKKRLEQAQSKKSTQKPVSNDNTLITAVITAAVNAYRKNN